MHQSRYHNDKVLLFKHDCVIFNSQIINHFNTFHYIHFKPIIHLSIQTNFILTGFQLSNYINRKRIIIVDFNQSNSIIN